jgi:hypothetical protein
MNNANQGNALIELQNRVSDLEARVRMLENWKLVHTSMNEEEEHTNQ